MIQDDQIKAVINLKKNFVTNSGWRINCENQEIKDFFTNLFQDLNTDAQIDYTFEESLHDILSSYEYGFSVTEPIYKLNKNNKWVYKTLKTRPPHTFKFDIDKYGEILNIIQSTESGELNLKPDKFFHHVYQPQFGNPYGVSDLQAAHNAWKAKKFIERFFAVYLEKFATPTVVGRYDTSMGESERNRFFDTLKTIQNNTTVIMPKDAAVDIVQNARDSSDAYLKALDYYNLRIARGILVPDLLGLSGSQTSGGSYALGSSQASIFFGIIKKDRQSLQEKINSKLIKPILALNFSDSVPCRFEFVPFMESSLVEYAKVWVQAVNGSMFKPTDEEVNYFRSILGFPEGEVEIPEPVQNRPFYNSQKDNLSKKEEAKKFSFQREFTTYEKKVDFKEVEKTLDNTENATKSAISSMKDVYTDYIAQVKDKGILRRFKPESINDLVPKFQKPLNKVLFDYFQEVFTESRVLARKEILPNGVREFDNETLLPEKFITLLRAESFKIVGDYTTDLTKKMKNIIFQGIKEGVSEGDIVQLLKSEAIEFSEKWANTLIRTKTTEIYNLSRRSYWENDPIAKQIVVAYQYSAILDDRTSEVCRYLDKKVYEITSDVENITPPLHFNCRSLLIPITKFEEYEINKTPSLDSINDKGGSLKNFNKLNGGN